MLSIAAVTALSGAAPSFAAVVMTPVPSGLERNSRSPARRPPLMSTRSGWTRPVTHSPYFGSLSMTVWPPAMTPPASATFSAPPRKTSATMLLSISRGKPATASANSTSPPIAYTSDMALAAATAPHVHGSSTTGGKKSTVSTSASSSLIR